jgi:hypothetical protein
VECDGQDIAEKRVDVVGERFLEQPAGAVETCLHGFRTKTQEIGGPLDAHVFDHSSHKDRAKFVGQPSMARSRSWQSWRWAMARSWSVGGLPDKGKGNDLGGRWRRRIRESGGELGPASDPLQCLVEHDGAEPSGEARISPELGQRRERAEIGLLQHVLGFAIVANHAARDAVEASIVRLDDGANCGRFLLLALATCGDRA